jgi:hypothetical protein
MIQKIINGRRKQRSGRHTPARQKISKKKNIPRLPIVSSLILSTKLMIYRENPAKIPVWQKSAKVYHCFYSSKEQLQVAL